MLGFPSFGALHASQWTRRWVARSANLGGHELGVIGSAVRGQGPRAKLRLVEDPRGQVWKGGWMLGFPSFGALHASRETFGEVDRLNDMLNSRGVTGPTAVGANTGHWGRAEPRTDDPRPPVARLTLC